MKIVLTIICILALLFIAGYIYYGGFKKMEFAQDTRGGETIVFEKVTGDYKQAGSVSDKIYHSLLNDEKLQTTRGVGIFYDDPRKIEKDKLRSEVGCIIENPDSAILKKLEGKYLVKTLPKANFVVTEFPLKGKLSFLLAIIKVYPGFVKYNEEHGIVTGPITEIYDVPNKKIIYRKAVLKQNR